MKTITFIRSAKYDYLIPGKNLYDSFDLLAKNQHEKSITPPAKRPQQKFDLILCSERKRCLQTAHLFGSEDRIIILTELNEIAYSMPELLSKDDFGSGNKDQVNRARENLVNKLISNQLSEKYSPLMARIQKLTNQIIKLSEQNILIISHGFFLKIVESAIKEPQIIKQPKLLLKYYDGKNQTYDYQSGFVAIEKENHLKFAGYIKL